MKAVVLYESMYGNTHRVAEAVGRGLSRVADVAVVRVGQADAALAAGADLVVIGGPTHAHGISRPTTRKAAVDQARDGEDGLVIEPGADDSGLREWFASLGQLGARSAAFDTRVDAPALFTGRASKGIAKQLRHHGSTVVVEPESFLVTKDSKLAPGEEARAEEWGERLGLL